MMNARIATVVLAPALVLLAATTAGAAQDLDVEGVDGFLLRATYHAGDDGASGILLLHQCNRDRQSYAGLGAALAEAGFHVLALDFRGFGESVGGEVSDYHAQADTLWPKFPGDVDAALDVLLGRPGVGRGAVGVLGASCGGSQQILLSMREPRVAAMVFLSSSVPWIDETVRTEFLRERDMPLFVIAAEDDRRTAEVSRELFDGSTSGDSKLLLYKGGEHGVPLFGQDPSLIAQIVAWFEEQL